MSKKTPAVHVISNPRGGWSVKKEGNTKASVVLKTKEGAVNRAREISKKDASELIIHKKDGTIQQRDSHGNDPLPPKDRDTHKK